MVTDEDVIARASGGVALCGTYVGESDERCGHVRAKKQLLRSPEQCKLMNSGQMSTVRSHSCSTIVAGEGFREAVKNSGWTAAMNLHAKVCEFGVGAVGEVSRHTGKQTSLSSLDMSKEACHMQVWYCPKASFAIPLHQMQLSEEALNDARRVQNPADAKKFLSDYNSHVSTGKYHVGGVLMKGLVMRARTTTSLQKMLENVSTNKKLGAGVNFDLFKVGGKVQFPNANGSSSGDLRASHQATVEYVYTALGPGTDDEGDFKARLSDNSTWDIIDKVDGPELVPVWEIPAVRNAEDLQNCCALLREAWQNSVKSIAAASEGKVYSLLQSSYMEYVKSLLDVSSTSADLNMDTDTLKKVWLEMTENLDSIRKKDLFQLTKFHDLLSRLAESTQAYSLHEGRALVQSLINHDVQVWLKEEDIHLRSSVQALLRNEVETVVPLPPLEDMSRGGLVDRLKILLGQQSSGATMTAAFDSKAVGKAIRDFFRQHRNGGDPVEGVRKLIMVHGFDENGRIRDMTRVTREEVNVLVNELESMTSGFRNPTPTVGLPEVEDAVAGPVTPRASRSRISNMNKNLDILGRNPHLLDLERSSKTSAVGSIPEGIFTVYSRHMLVDGPKDISAEPRRRMMDRIKHRLEPFASTLSKPADVSQRKNFFPRRVNKGTSRDDIGKPHREPHSTLTASPLHVLVQLLTSSDLLAQTALFQLLLDARIAIPLIVPVETRTEENSCFVHLAEALDFVRVKLAKQEILSIAEDTKLPRVLFLSMRKFFSTRETSHMASKVMNFQLSSKFLKGDTGDGNAVIELGVGFLRTSEDESQDHKPCLVFCVSGDHYGLEEFLAKVADFVIIEMDPSEDASSRSWVTGHFSSDNIIYWKINPSEQGWQDEPYCTFWGSFQWIADQIEGYLLQGIVEEKLFKGASGGGAATLKQCLSTVSIPTFSKETPVSNLANLRKIELEKAKDSLKLQKNFAQEAVVYFESLRRRSEPEYDLKRIKLQNERKNLASEVQGLPLLQTFISILFLENYVERSIGIVKLELNIEKKLHLILKRAHEKEAQAFEESQRHEDNLDLKQKYILARREHVGKKLGLEHLWRELSHIFVANTRLKYLPQLAAEHLIDGFPLEILDGDAGMFNSVWVESVLSELNKVLSSSLKHKPKVFVLSVIGLQSSGKSTLLNVMFGTKLKTSAGQCTRGVYFQLIKSERKEFDYVLILDTEGIRSPEFFHEKNADVHDNRLATFAVLPADACIVMVANEDDNGLKEVLPMVMLAFKESAMAKQCAGRRHAKVCFAYRSVDTNDVSKLGRNERKLQEYLRGASRQLGHSDTLLKDFHISTTEEDSDVKYFGNLKKGNVPPGDTPDWNYGTKVEALREYIHKRVVDDGWKAYELNSWASHLKLVWDCISEANFEIGFRNQMEYIQFEVLQDKLVASRKQVGKTWMEEFEKLAGELQVERGTDQGVDRSFRPLWNKLKLTVQTTVDETAEEVKETLEHPQSQKWKVGELANWTNFCSDQERDWQQRLEDYVDAVFKFDDVVKDYNAKIQMEIDAKTRNLDMMAPNRGENMKREFDEIFQRILSQAQGEHPPMAEEVDFKVTRVYTESPITGQRFAFPAKEESSGHSNPPKKSSTSWFQIGYLDSTDYDGIREVTAVLESKVKAYLQDKTQYADHLVEEMIRSTEKQSKGARLPKQEEYAIHCHVKKMLTEKLVAIQEKWDKNHNVAKRLEKEEQRLWLFFQNLANKVDGTKLLFTEIDNLLKSRLMDSFRCNLSNHVANKLINDAWAGNWIVMRAHLDLHLVELMEASNTNELLKCVTDGAIHYKTVVDDLIEQEVLRQVRYDHLWVSFLKKIKEAISAAAVRTSVSESGSSKSTVFIKNLVQSINDIGAGSLELTRNISNYVSEEVYSKSGDILDFAKLASDLCGGLDTDIKPDFSRSSIQEVVKLVTDRMIQCATDNAGPRCAEKCPHCMLTCFRPVNHPGHHDTLHQPQGLGGMYFVTNNEFVPESCSDHAAIKGFFFFDQRDEKVLYTDWNKQYTEWKVPTKGSVGTVHVREYIFAHYQKDIVEFYSITKGRRLRRVCTTIPPRYLLHDIGALRCQLESTIAST